MFFSTFLITIILMFSTLVSADENKSLLTAETLNEFIPADFTGILFNCEPLCQFISIKLKDAWAPPLKTSYINQKNPKLVSSSDPLYPLLIQELPVLPHTENKPLKNNIKNENKDKPLDPPPTAFNFGFNLKLGLRTFMSDTSSNLAVQEKASPRGALSSMFVEAGVMKARPSLIFGQWVQFQAFYTIDSDAHGKNLNENPINQSQNEILISALLFKPNYKIGLKYAKSSSSYKTNPDILSSYSYKENNSWIGLLWIWDHLSINADYALVTSFEDEQSIRDKLLKVTQFRFEVGYCTKEKEIVDIHYLFCFGFKNIFSSTSSTLKPDFNSDKNLDLNSNDKTIKVSFQVGDDFFK